MPTLSLFLARTSETLNTPHVSTFHYLEFLQIRGPWIYPDVGYLDFGQDNYREFFIGGGRTIYDSKFFKWDQELLFVQAMGPAAGSARYLQPWTMLNLRFTPKWTSETVYFAYLPINRTAEFHHVIERAKLEYAVDRRWTVGAGYAGYNVPRGPWMNQPLLTTTISTSAGAFEFWLQKAPGGARVELRYQLAHASR